MNLNNIVMNLNLKDFSDIQYYLKKEEKREKITNYNDVISKCEKIYNEIISKANT